MQLIIKSLIPKLQRILIYVYLYIILLLHFISKIYYFK